jgi:WG containing repeat
MIRRTFMLSLFIISMFDLVAQAFPDTSLPALIPYRKGNFWGFCNKERQLVIPAKYYSAEPFKKQYALVRIDSVKEAIIDNKGKVICTAQKDTILYNSDSGRIYIYIEPDRRILAVKEPNGEWFVPKKYKVYKSLSMDLYLAKYKKRVGIIDVNENVILPFKYKNLSSHDEMGFILAEKMNGREGFIDKNGKILIAFRGRKYSLSSFSEDLASISYGKGYNNPKGFIDRSGKLVIPMIYKKAYWFRDGLCEVSDGIKTGFINKKGDTVISFKYGLPLYFEKGYISYNYTERTYSSLYNTTDREILKVRANFIEYINDSIIIIGKKEAGQLGSLKYGIVDIAGKEIWPCEYKGIYCNLYPGLISVLEGGFYYYMDYRFNKYYED